MSLMSFWPRAHLTSLLAMVLLLFGYFGSSVIVNPISFFFKVSSFTGQILVNKFLTVFDWTLEIVKLTYQFFEILYEDSLIFLKDAAEKLTSVVFLLRESYLFVEGIGWSIVKLLLQLGEVISNVVAFFYYTILAFKEGIQFCGRFIWRAFLTAPEVITSGFYQFYEFILNTINAFHYLISKVQEEIIDGLERTYLFFFDIQLDSVYGLIIGAVLLAVFYFKFKDICFFMTSASLKLYRWFISFGINLLNGRFLENSSRRKTNNNIQDEALCIVCQYRLKEMIIFPCRHLCLCRDCSSLLTKSRPFCPICRCDITETLKVYW